MIDEEKNIGLIAKQLFSANIMKKSKGERFARIPRMKVQYPEKKAKIICILKYSSGRLSPSFTTSPLRILGLNRSAIL